MIMKKNLLFILFLVMPIALIGISIYNKDIERIERAFYFCYQYAEHILCLP